MARKAPAKSKPKAKSTTPRRGRGNAAPTANRTAQRNKAKGRAGNVGDMAALESAVKDMAEDTFEDALKAKQTLPPGTYYAKLGDCTGGRTKPDKGKVPYVRMHFTCICDEDMDEEFSGVPVTKFYRLENPDDPENNWGLANFVDDIRTLGYDLHDKLEIPGLVTELDAAEIYVKMGVDTSESKGKVYTNHYINAVIDPSDLGL